MSLDIKNPPAGGADGSSEEVSFATELPPKAQNRPTTQITNPRAVRETKLELLREAVHEACGFIQIHANVCQYLAEAGDNAGLIHSIGRLVIYTKLAAVAGNELRELRKEPPP